MLSSGRFLRIALAVVGLLAAALLLSVSAVQSPEQSHLLSNLIQSLILLWAAVCAFVAARRSSPYFRQLWLLLGAALSLAAAGQLGVLYYANILQTPRDIPWPSDVLLFIWVAPAAMMLLPWRWDESSPARWERILDFAQIAIVFVTAYLYFFYVPSLWKAHGMLMFQRLVEAAAARDFLLAGGFLLRSVTLPRSSTRGFFARIGVFFAALGVVEGVGIASLLEMTRAAAVADAAWALPFVYLVVLAATWFSTAESQPTLQASDQSLWVASQILPVTIPLLVIFMGRQIAREQITIAALAIATSFSCSAARLLLTSQRQRRIAEDLRRAEHAARQSEQMFSAAFRSSPDAISISQVPEGTILEINESYTRVTGFQREEILGKTPEGLGLWVDREIMLDMRTRFREQGELRDEDLRFRRKDGAIRDGQLSGAIITLDGRRYSLIVVSDITERKQAEDAIRRSEERFRSLVRDLQVGVILVRPDGEMQFGNTAALEMFGLKEEELVGQKASNLSWIPIHEDGSEMPFAMRPVARAIETRQPVRGTVMGWRRRDSDEVLWIIGNAIPQLNQNGEVETVITSFADITGLRKTQEALRSSEERFRSLVQILRVGICTWGPDGRLQYVNQALLDMFEPPKEPILGKTSAELMEAVHEDGTAIPVDMRPSARVIETRRPVRNQVIGWRNPGSKEIVWTLVDAAPEIAPDGRLVRVIASLTNISEQKRAEEALRQLSTRLLQLQDEERRRLGRDLHDSLAQSVLAVNLSLAQVTQSCPTLDGPSRKILGDARSMLQDMSRQIRTLSYLLHPPLLDELGLASAVKEYAEGFGERSGIRVQVGVAPGFGRLPQETETALFRIVQESLANIQRHSGSPTARIRLGGNSAAVLLEVSDEGQGIPRAQGKKLSAPGTRFGVGIVGMRERMAQLGGSLEIDSSPSGTTVRATLPLKTEVLHAAAHPRRG
jgi:PAS domain S-box-containing protein